MAGARAAGSEALTGAEVSLVPHPALVGLRWVSPWVLGAGGAGGCAAAVKALFLEAEGDGEAESHGLPRREVVPPSSAVGSSGL